VNWASPNPENINVMPNTYTQLFVQLVFAVKGRESLIPKGSREQIHKYITSVVQKDGNKMLAVFCMQNHIHLLIGLNPSISISALVLDIKRASTNFINENNIVRIQFNWQKGFGVFSYSKSQVNDVVNYILNQEAHHQKKTFRQEYVEFLQKFEVEYEEKYLFEFIDEA
jgi:REP element-mobilizing transposase RayT